MQSGFSRPSQELHMPRCIPHIQFCFGASQGLRPSPLGFSFHSFLTRKTKRERGGLNSACTFNVYIRLRKCSSVTLLGDLPCTRKPGDPWWIKGKFLPVNFHKVSQTNYSNTVLIHTTERKSMDTEKHFSLFRSSRSRGEGLFLEEVRQTDYWRNEQESFGQRRCDGGREAKVWTS